nr:hypothetical protein [Tanacetum cinerariifolium]
MLNKDNYVPWSSRIIRYARSRLNGKMIVDSIENGPYVRRMIATPGEPSLLADGYHFSTKGIPVTQPNTTKKTAWDDKEGTSTLQKGITNEKYTNFCYYTTKHDVLDDVDHTAFQLTAPTNNNQRNSSNPHNRQIAQSGIANQNGTGNVVAARAEGTGNGNQARCYNCRGFGHMVRNYTIRPKRRDVAYLQTQLLFAQKKEAGIQLQAEEFDFMAIAGDMDEIEEVNANCILMANLQHASTSGTQLEKAPVYDIDGSAENENHVTSVTPSMVQSGGTVETSSTPNKETRAHQETVYRNLVDQVAQNGLVVVPGIANQNGTGNVVAARAEGTGNGNQAMCYNCRGFGHMVRNYTVRPRRRDVAYLQTQLLIAQKKEAGIQLQAEEFNFMAVAGDMDEIEEVNANCILMVNLQHASTSGTQLEKAPVYDTDGSAENENHVTSVAPSMVQSGGTVEISSAPNKETRAHQETVYRNLVDQVAQLVLKTVLLCLTRRTMFHGHLVFSDDELTEKELKQIKADDQAIQTILLGLPKDIYAAIDSCETAQEIWLHITDPTTVMNMALALMAKASKLNYSTPTNNNQRISSNPRNRQIAQPGMNMGQDRQMQMVGGNGGNQFRQYAKQNVGNLNGYNDVQNVGNGQNAIQNSRIQNVGNQSGLIGVPGNANQNPNGNGNLVAARAESNATGHNGNQIRCYNCKGMCHFSRNCTVKPRRRDVAYLQTQLLIAQKEKAGIQLQAEEFDLMAVAADLDEIEEVNANFILMSNLQQASTSGTQTDKAPVYDSDRSAEVHNYEDCYDNEIFNMFTQEEQYTELLEPIPEPHQVPHNDNNVISEDSSVEQNGGTVEQHLENVEETRALYDSLHNNLAIEVKKVNAVNRKLSETNAELTTELARYKNQEKCFEISQEKYEKLERCYQKSVYQEQCLSKKINALHLSFEKKKLKSDFKIREDELLDKQIQLEKKIKELDNILVKTGQSIQTIHMLSPKPDLFYHTEHMMDLSYQNPFYLKQAQQKQQSLYEGKVLFEKHDPPVVHDSEETLQLAQEKAAKFVGDFKSFAKEADESLVKHKALELEINRLLRAVVSQDIMSVVQSNSGDETSNLQTEVEHTKERFENCIIKKENKYAKLWNDWYQSVKNANSTKFRTIKLIMTCNKRSNGCKLSWEISRVLNYAKENAHLKTTYKNLFDSISVTRTQTKTIINCLQNKLQDTIYENAKLRAQLFDKVSDQKDTAIGTSTNTKFAKQSILGKTPKVGKTHALLKPVTSNSIPTPQGSKVVKNVKVIALGMFRINPFKPSREEKHVPNKVRASVRRKPVTVSQPPVITKKVTIRPEPRSNTKNDRVPSVSKSSRSKNKEVEVKEHHRKLLLSRNKKHMSSE